MVREKFLSYQNEIQKGKPMEEILQWGKLDKYELPLNRKNDFMLNYKLMRHKDPKSHEERKVYIASFYISFDDKVLVDDLISYEEFMATLKIFTDKRDQYEDADNMFFEKKTKTKDSMVSLKLLNTDRHVNLREATQMSMLIHGAFLGCSKKLMYKGYQVETIDVMSSDTSKKFRNPNLKNTKVIDILKPRPDSDE